MRAVRSAETLARGAEASLAPGGTLMISRSGGCRGARGSLPRASFLAEELMLPDSETARLLVFSEPESPPDVSRETILNIDTLRRSCGSLARPHMSRHPVASGVRR